MSKGTSDSETQAITADSQAESSLPRIVRNSTFNAVGMLLIVPLNFVALFTMARRLGAESVGAYFTIFAICAVVHWIADAGTSTMLTRHVARTREDLPLILAEAIGIMFVVFASSVVVFAGISVPWTAATWGFVPASILVAAASAMIARHAIDFAANVFRGLERFEFENLGRVIQAATFCLLVWFGVHPGESGTLQAFVAYAVSNYLAAVLLWGVLLSRWCCPTPKFSREIAARWYRESYPLGVGDVVRQLVMRIDTLLLSILSSSATVGLFSVASRPLQPLRMVPRTIVSVTFPSLSRMAHIDRAKFSRTFAKTTNLLWIGSLPICIAVAACAEPLVLATAGPDFANAINPLRLLIWSTVLVFINAQLRFTFTALDTEDRYWRLTVGSLLVKVLAGAVLIACFGLYGACAAVLVGECAMALGGMWILRSMQVKGPTWAQLVRAVPAAALMALVLIPFASANSSLWMCGVGLALASVVYVVACLVTGAWPLADALQLLNALRKSFGGTAGVVAPSQSP